MEQVRNGCSNGQRAKRTVVQGRPPCAAFIRRRPSAGNMTVHRRVTHPSARSATVAREPNRSARTSRIAVALYHAGPRLYARVLHGAPRSERATVGGRVVFFDAGALVLYELQTRRAQAYLFRGAGTVDVPGVRPAVNVLVHATTREQLRRLQRSLDWMEANGYRPGRFPDLFWLKLHALLNKDGYGTRALKALLRNAA